MAGANQHFIPRQLLRKFGDPSGRITTLRSSGRPFTLSIERIGYERNFNDPPGPGSADEAITRAEGHIGRLLVDFWSAQAGPTNAEAAASVIAHLTSRTRAMRNFLRDAHRLCLAKALQHATSEGGKAEVAAHVRRNREMLVKGLDERSARTQSAAQHAVWLASPARSWAICWMLSKLDAMLPDTWDGARQTGVAFARAVAPQLPSMVRGAHNRAAREEPTPAERVRFLRQFSYELVDYSANLLLGDCVAVGFRPGRRVCPLFALSAELEGLVMPLSPNRALFGWASGRREVDAEILNLAATAAATEYVFAQPPGDGIAEHSQFFGAARRQGLLEALGGS